MYVLNIKQIAQRYNLNRRTAKKKSKTMKKIYRINKNGREVFVGYLIEE